MTKEYSTDGTDSVKPSIGAIDVLCSRDDVKREVASPSAPEEPMHHQSKRRCNDVSKEQRLSTDQVSPEVPTP